MVRIWRTKTIHLGLLLMISMLLISRAVVNADNPGVDDEDDDDEQIEDYESSGDAHSASNGDADKHQSPDVNTYKQQQPQQQLHQHYDENSEHEDADFEETTIDSSPNQIYAGDSNGSDDIDNLDDDENIESSEDNDKSYDTSSNNNQPSSGSSGVGSTNGGVAGDQSVFSTYQNNRSKLLNIIKKPGILAGIVGGAIIGILTAILLIMFIVYRMRKKDEGSYALEETKKPLNAYDYRHCPTKEFYA